MWRKQYAIPPEHGAWIWWVGPLLLGTAAAGTVTPAWGAMAVAALAAFLIRQPAGLLVKVLSGRRGRGDLSPAIAWLSIYGCAIGAAAAVLLQTGHVKVVLLGLAGAPLFLWHLALVRRKQDRHRLDVDLAAAATLALTAPAAYWAAGGASLVAGAVLWATCAAKSAASVVHVTVKLRQRRMKEAPAPAESTRMHAPALIFHGVNVAGAAALAVYDLAPWLVTVAFAAILAEACVNAFQPATGKKPVQIGLRQLVVSSAFYFVAAVGYLAE